MFPAIAVEPPVVTSKVAKKLLKHPEFKKALEAAPEFTKAVLKELDKYAPKESLEELAKKGNARAQAQLAWEYTYGEEKNPELAFEWSKKAAAQGITIGEFILGRSYDMGLGSPKDPKEAVKWYRKAADKGLNIAQLNLGVLYSRGEGVPEDHKEAVKWYRKAAAPILPEFGKGIGKQVDQSLVALNDNTERTRLTAQYNLGWKYFYGDGVQKDFKESVEWFRKSAEGGFIRSQYSFGLLYASGGDGVPRNLVTAYAWHSIAAFSSHSEASSALVRLGKVMAPDDIAKAQKLNREMIKKNPKLLRNIR